MWIISCEHIPGWHLCMRNRIALQLCPISKTTLFPSNDRIFPCKGYTALTFFNISRPSISATSFFSLVSMISASAPFIDVVSVSINLRLACQSLFYLTKLPADMRFSDKILPIHNVVYGSASREELNLSSLRSLSMISLSMTRTLFES